MKSTTLTLTITFHHEISRFNLSEPLFHFQTLAIISSTASLVLYIDCL